MSMLNKKSIEDINVTGKKTLVRCDFNVPLRDGEITDLNRIHGALPTIKYLSDNNARVILCSHLGKPKNGYEAAFSLEPVAKKLSELLGKEVRFAADPQVSGDIAKEVINEMKDGDIVLLENTRFRKEETKNEESFSRELASLADIFVNDAFGTAHRAHASTAVIAGFFPDDRKMFGFLIDSELAAMDRVLKDAGRPFTAVMGGAKVSDKILIIENLLDRVDNLIIGGGMTYTFIRAMGGRIGNSLCEEDKLEVAKAIIEKARIKGVNFLLPADGVNADRFDAGADTYVSAIDDVRDGWMGLDIGEKAIRLFEDVIMKSKTILWNGPMGVFEMDKFAAGTTAIAKAVARATEQGAFSLIGGGDSVAAINKNGLADKVSYVSTGGGAMLEYMEGKTLPGIAAIRG